MFLINEIFLSVQGEGPSVGHTALFVRFSGCNTDCQFCDTSHTEYSKYSLNEIIDRIKGELCVQGWPAEKPGFKVPIRCVLTGGEPLLQITHEMIQELISLGFFLCIETNGSKELLERRNPDNLMAALLLCDEIVVSPKLKEVSVTLLELATCLKVLYPIEELNLTDQSIRDMVDSFYRGTGKKDLVVQPISPKESDQFDRSFFDRSARAHLWAIERFREYGEVWRVIPQMHRLVNMR